LETQNKNHTNVNKDEKKRFTGSGKTEKKFNKDGQANNRNRRNSSRPKTNRDKKNSADGNGQSNTNNKIENFVNSLDLKDKVIFINRVTKVVKGGRNFRFAALVVVGDENGHVGIGLGKASEVIEAIRKGKEDAKKNLVVIKRNQNDSVYHEIIGEFGSSKVLIKPAAEGTGVIAGGPVRMIMELAGIRNIRTKSIGSRNKHNVTKAVINGLRNLKTPDDVARLRGKLIGKKS